MNISDINVGDKGDDFQIMVNRGIKNRKCSICERDIVGGTIFSEIVIQEKVFLMGHMGCFGKLTAAFEIFTKKLEKYQEEKPPPSTEKKE